MNFNVTFFISLILSLICYSKKEKNELLNKKGYTKQATALEILKINPIPCVDECYFETDDDNHCKDLTINSSGTFLNYYHCPKNETKTYCYSDNSDHYAHCKPIKKFYHEYCSSDEECFTEKCKNKKCEYKEDFENCTSHKSCKQGSYCSNGHCEPFLQEGDYCDKEYQICHPKYYCNGRCIEKGTKENGATAYDNFECKSFILNDTEIDNYCVDSCNESLINCQLQKMQARIFKKINWEKVKLSDYAGQNMGDVEYFKLDMKKITQIYDNICGNETASCLYPWFQENTLIDCMTDDNTNLIYYRNYLSDDNVKKLLQLSSAFSLNSQFKIKLIFILSLVCLLIV